MRFLCKNLVFSLLLASGVMADSEIASPDGRIVLRAYTEDGPISYSVDFEGEPLIAKSGLGVELKQGGFMDAVVSNSQTRTSEGKRAQVWGQFGSEIEEHFNELTLGLKSEETGHRMQVVLRAYDDGVAFRYHFPKQEGLKEIVFKKEYSEVALVSENPIAWYPRSTTELNNDVSFDDIKKPCRTPFTVKLAEDRFVSLHEAAVVSSSDARLILGKDKRTLNYSCSFNNMAEVMSPWRTIQITSRPGGLIESTLILNLNSPTTMKDTSWVKPGVTLWDWRNHGGKADDGFVYGINTESYVRYIDFAAEQGIPYLLIDAEWYGPERSVESDPITYEHEVDIPKVASYGKEKGVGVWLYLNDRALKHFDIDRTFKQYQEWGIKGIKHGFLGAGNQVKNAFSVKVLKKCEEYEIMYVFHEPNKPTGLSATYPHYMSSEYVNSMLDSASRMPATPSELCVFPVVHNLGGPVDRSCGLFDMDQSILRDKVHKQIPSTVVSQTAQCLVFNSGLLTLPDMPDAYRRKQDLFEFIRALPMTYDETKVLEMEIGNYLTMARRADETWFVASLADEEGRELEVTLDFLKPGVTYQAMLFEDTAESHYQFPGPWSRKDASKKKIPFKPVKTKRELYQVRSLEVKRGDKIVATIAPGGGHCMLLKPKK